MGQFTIGTSALSLARMLWWYGEDDLWPRALALQPREVAAIGITAGEFHSVPHVLERIWPTPPPGADRMVTTVHALSGEWRRCPRNRRRPQNKMPAELVASEEERWSDPDFAEVRRLLDSPSGDEIRNDRRRPRPPRR